MTVCIPADLQQKIRTRFSNRCAYCQTREDLSVAIFEFEQILPRSTGGKTEFKSLCLSCPTCNRYKAQLHGGAGSDHALHADSSPEASFFSSASSSCGLGRLPRRAGGRDSTSVVM